MKYVVNQECWKENVWVSSATSKVFYETYNILSRIVIGQEKRSDVAEGGGLVGAEVTALGFTIAKGGQGDDIGCLGTVK